MAPTKERKRDFESNIRFVKAMTGSCNESDYKYMGIININENKYNHGGSKAKVSKYSKSHLAFNYFWQALVNNDLSQLEVLEATHCARCGRKLTTPDSIQDGFGPECVWKIGLPNKEK